MVLVENFIPASNGGKRTNHCGRRLPTSEHRQLAAASRVPAATLFEHLVRFVGDERIALWSIISLDAQLYFHKDLTMLMVSRCQPANTPTFHHDGTSSMLMEKTMMAIALGVPSEWAQSE